MKLASAMTIFLIGSSEVSVAQNTGVSSPKYLKENFGIAERLSDCDIASQPVTDAMSKSERSLAQSINTANRTACISRWQTHQTELSAERDAAAAKAQRDRVDQFVEYNKSHPPTSDEAAVKGAQDAAKAAIDRDRRRK